MDLESIDVKTEMPPEVLFNQCACSYIHPATDHHMHPQALH